MMVYRVLLKKRFRIVIRVTYHIFYKIKLKTGYAFVLRKTKGELVIYSKKYLCRILSPHFTIFNISNSNHTFY